MDVLVTGGSGFLGRHLVDALRRRGDVVVSLSSRDADLRNSGALAGWRDRRFDRLYHLAAWTEAGDFCVTHPGEQWLVNQQINTTVLRFWQEAQPQARLISMGTSCAYAEGSGLREDEYLLGTPIADLYAYAMTKRMLLVGQQSLQRQFGLTWFTAVPSTVYGPRYHLGTKQMHFIFDLAWKLLAHKHYGAPVALWGDGRQRREVVFIDDFIQTLLDVEPRATNEVVNIGAGEDHTIGEFAQVICGILGLDPAVISYDESRYVGARAKSLSVERLEALAPDRPRTPLTEGLRRMLDWLEPAFLTATADQSAPPGTRA